jgi:hypothetical protein
MHGIAKDQLTEPTGDSMNFPAMLRQALDQLDDDHRLLPAVARELRRAIATTSREETLDVAYRPEKHLGRFDSLPEPARAAIVQAIVDRDGWEVRGYELGPWYPLLLRLLWRLKHQVYRWGAAGSRWSRYVREVADVLAYGTRKAPAYVIRGLRRQQLALKGRFSSRPTLPEVLGLAGLDPQEFAICYARGISQIERYRGYWHDPARQNTVGRVLGLDLLPTASGFWLAETNTNPAQRPERSALYERDPFVSSLLNFAARHGYRHLMVLDNNSSGVDAATARAYEEEARNRGIQLTLVDLPNVPSRARARSYCIPPLADDGTLVVRIRWYPTSLDRLFGLKRASYRALALYQRETGDPDLLLPPSSAEPVLADVDPDEPFPNVVYKLPDLQAGRGVYFLKASSPEHARAILRIGLHASQARDLQARLLRALTTGHGLYQAYVKSSLLADRCLYIVRAHVLLTPAGIRFLSAHRVVSSHAVPEHLPAGIVRDARPYLVNFSVGSSRYEVVPEEEEPAVVRAATAVARGLAWAAEYGFRIS